jgi:hypothetical protein
MLITKKRLSELSGLTINSIDRLIAQGIFRENLHYRKVSERKILFDENALSIANLKDINDNIYKERETMGKLISEWTEGTKIHKACRYKRE